MPISPGALAETDRLLTTTRAVRKRLDLARPVEHTVIEECLQIAVQAPSGANSQPWRWLVVDDPAVRAGLADLYRRSHDPYLAAQRQAAADAGRGGPALDRGFDSSAHLSDHLHEVPVHVVPCLLGRLPERPSAMDMAGFYGSILPATWSFMLALRSRGLGSAFTTLHLAYEREAAALLGVPDTVTQVALIPVAYYTGEDFTAAERRPVAEVMYWNRWRAARDTR
jgi:nitroreductase